jgi:hypothetical protein
MSRAIASTDEIFIHCSQLSKIMGDGKQSAGLTENQEQELFTLQNKVRTEKQDARMQELLIKKDWKPEYDLSEGAKNFTRELVRQMVFGYDSYFSAKETLKGTAVEDDSILLYNDVFGTAHKKNKIRMCNAWLNGECDIDAPEFDLIIDIKSSWSKETFPALPDEIDVSGYEWQGRGYMMLYNRNRFELAFCLVNTPWHLLRWESNTSIHYVDDIEKEFRVTSLFFDRDMQLEEKIKYKVNEVRRYAKWYEAQLLNKFERNRNK